MSDSGWWQASDGKWYPPESRPAAQPPVAAAPPAAVAPPVTTAPQAAVAPPVAQPQVVVVPAEGTPGKGFAIAGLVCGILSAGILPIILGPLGVIFGSLSWSKNNTFGMVSTLVAIPCMVMGMLFGMIVWSAL